MTMARRTHTTIAIGTNLLRPSARLDAPNAVTKRISSVAYAVDDNASDENTASAMVFGSRCSSIWVVASGRPTNNRFNTPSIDRTSRSWSLLGVGTDGQAADLARPRHGDRDPQLVGEGDCQHPRLQTHRNIRTADGAQAPALPTAVDDGQFDAVAREHEAGVEPQVLYGLHGAAAIHARQHPAERPQLEPAVPQAEQVEELAPDVLEDDGERRALSDVVGHPVHPEHVLGRRLVRSPGAAAPRRHLSDEEPDGQEDERGLEVVGAVDPRREERLGEEEV